MEFNVYQRPNKKCKIDVRKRELAHNAPIQNTNIKIIEVDKNTECHITPDKESLKMVDYLGYISEGSRILEPQAGTGQLIKALLERGVNVSQITAIERNVSLMQSTAEKYQGLDIVNDCFLEYSKFYNDKKFDFILSNPPFKNKQKHVKACIDLLDENGVMVALVPTTFFYKGFIDLENLSNDVFRTARVNTKIVYFCKNN